MGTTIARHLLQLLSKSTVTICGVPLYLSAIFLCVLVCMNPLLFHRSSGPQKCSACIKEDIFEEQHQFLKQGVCKYSFYYTVKFKW